MSHCVIDLLILLLSPSLLMGRRVCGHYEAICTYVLSSSRMERIREEAVNTHWCQYDGQEHIEGNNFYSSSVISCSLSCVLTLVTLWENISCL